MLLTSTTSRTQRATPENIAALNEKSGIPLPSVMGKDSDPNEVRTCVDII